MMKILNFIKNKTNKNKFISGNKMKTKFNIIFFTIYALSAFCISSCTIGLPSGDEQTNKDLFVDMGTFSVSYPAGDDWTCETDKIKKIVSFARYKRWITGSILGTTIISISEELILQDTIKISEKETADRYLNSQLLFMRDEGVKKGKFVIQDYKMIDTTINGKKFYCMIYTTSAGSSWEGNEYETESILVLYLPPDFKDKHKIYVFDISDTKRSGTMIGQNPWQIYPVLRSFILK